MGLSYHDTQCPHVTAEEKAALLEPHPPVPLPWGRHPVQVVDLSEQAKAAERIAADVPIEHIEPPRRPMGHSHDLQRGAFDRDRAWHGRIGDRVMTALFLLVLLGLAAGWFN